MTFCIGMRMADGLIAIADTQVTSGTERIVARKVTVDTGDRHAMFLMTAGLRSARDKALTYYEDFVEEHNATFDKLYKATNAFAAQLRRVSDEDRAALGASGLTFNLSTIVGGQMERDAEPKLYLLYPEGNWVEVARATPYFVIGESAYAKPLLDRTLRYDTTLRDALKTGVLAFEAARRSGTSVDYPIDVVVYKPDTYRVDEHRFERADLEHVSDWWDRHIREGVERAPSEWIDAAFALDGPAGVVPLERPS